MPTGIKDKIISKGQSVSQPAGGDTMQDVESPLKPDDKYTAQEIEEAQDTNIKAGATAGGKTTMYVYDRDIKAEKFGSEAAQKSGAPSLFNPFAVFTHPRVNTFNDFFDIGGNSVFPKYEGGKTGGRKLTYKSLLTDFDPEGNPDIQSNPAQPYYASDFIYLRYYKKIPLNKLITVRRFPFPTYDNLDFVGQGNESKFKPIAQAVSFFGEPTGNDLKELTKWSGQINWEELTAAVHDVEGNERGSDQSPFGGGVAGKIGASIMNPSGNDIGGFRAEEIEAQKFNTFEYTNKVLGPVNVVNQTYVRQRGLGAKKEFNIVFEYELRSYNNINPRLAMLDILCNMLVLTFNNAKFWGGANRYFPKSPQFGFAGDQKLFYQGRYGEYLDGVLGQIGSGAGGIFDQLGKMISGLLRLDFSAIGDVAKRGAFAFADLKRAKSRPQVLGFHALLTGLPIGEWHMTVGNPYRPIMTIGNLICKGFDFELSDHLGVDDFPSILKFTTKLETGRPRDKGDLESLFSMGEGRMYYPPEGLLDITNISSTAGGVSDDSMGVPSGNAGGGSTQVGPNANAISVAPAYNRANVDPEFARKLVGTAY